jgi:ArsR family metal-binding transcriptional regulator
MKALNNFILEKLHIDKDSKIKINIEDIKDRDTAIAYIKSLDYKVEDIESWDDKGKAVRIYFNDKLSVRIDFINKIEFLYTIYGPGDTVIRDVNSTEEADCAAWDRLLDMKKYAEHFRKMKAPFGRNKDRVEYFHRLADKIYSLL